MGEQSGPARSWRDAAPQSSKAASQAQRAWRKETTAPPPTPGRWKKRTKFGAAFASVLAAMGLLVLIAYLLWPPKPVALVLVGAGYETNLALPHNVFGREGLNRLVALADAGANSFFWGSGGFKARHAPDLRIDSQSWADALADVNEKAVIIYLSLHGSADKDGPYLLASDADPYQPDSKGRDKLRLEKVLEKLKEFPEKHKVLILDATQHTASWPSGAFYNDFVRALKKMEPAIEAVPHLVVLCSSDENQRSWASEEWRNTIFSHYVTEGLRGAADLSHNQHIDAQELHQYVLANVQRWARDNRNALQTPILLGASKDNRAQEMSLGVASGSYERPDPAEAPQFVVPPELKKAWERFHEIERRVPAPYTYAPHIWRKYQDTLLRYEHLIRAGDRTTAAELGNRLQWIESELTPSMQVAARSMQNSLAMPAAMGLPLPSGGEHLAGLFDKLWAAPAAEAQAKSEELHKWGDSQGWSKEALRLKASELLLERVAEAPDRNLRKSREILKLIEGTSPVRPTEVHFLVMLNRNLADTPPPEPGR